MSSNISNIYKEYQDQVDSARNTGLPLNIVAGNTKYFYGRKTENEKIFAGKISGVISYEPTELVITAYAGTTLKEINATLAEKRQMLAFEPPAFGEQATLGGTVACGLSGPRRPYVGSVRDFILGIKCLNGKGEIITFGGQVMKNVAGYDVSRLMTGAMGTLGLLLEISVKVLPLPEHEISLTGKADFNSALDNMNVWAGNSPSLSASAFDGTNLNIRLSGKQSAVESARKKFNMEEFAAGDEYWQQLREHQLAYFQGDDRSLWRLSVPSMTPEIKLSGDWLMEWGGAVRWLKSDETSGKVRKLAEQAGGYATLFRNNDDQSDVFHPLSPALKNLHLRLKQAFDPDRVFNRGRMYPDF